MTANYAKHLKAAIPAGWIGLREYCRRHPEHSYMKMYYQILVQGKGEYKRIGCFIIVPIDMVIAV